MVLVPQVRILHRYEQLLVALLDYAALRQIKLHVALWQLEQKEPNETDEEGLIVDLETAAHMGSGTLQISKDLRLETGLLAKVELEAVDLLRLLASIQLVMELYVSLIEVLPDSLSLGCCEPLIYDEVVLWCLRAFDDILHVSLSILQVRELSLLLKVVDEHH